MFAIDPLFTPSQHGLLSHTALDKTSETIGFLTAQQQQMSDVSEAIRKLVAVVKFFEKCVLKSQLWKGSPKKCFAKFQNRICPLKVKVSIFQNFLSLCVHQCSDHHLHGFKPAIQSNTLGEP